MYSDERGWWNEPVEHGLASKGIKTKLSSMPNPEGKRVAYAFEKTTDKDDNDESDRFWLDKQAKIYIPATSDMDREISDKKFEKRIREAQEEFSEKFGGTTTFLGTGTYVSKSGDFIKENIAVMQVNMTKDDWEQEKDEIYKWLKEKRDEWGQESLSFEFEGNITFIEKGPVPSDLNQNK